MDDNLENKINKLIEIAKQKTYISINTIMVETYFQIGKEIVEYQQKGKHRAIYGENLIKNLSQKLTKKYGKGFSERNLREFRKFFISFQKWQAVPAKLSWTHISLILRIEDQYILEFLNLEENYKYTEKEFEQKIIDNLQKFILELGNGFMFVARQQRITLDGEHFYIDLVFYNRILKCFVIIELKNEKLKHEHLGQLQMYVNYYDREIKSKEENLTIGILLCLDKKESIIKYTLPKNNEQIFASKYKLYLPDKKQLQKEIKKLLN